LKFWPITATGDVVIHGRTKPADFVPTGTVPFPDVVMSQAAAWHLLDNDGINPTAAAKAQLLFETSYRDLIAAVNEDVIGHGGGRASAPITIRLSKKQNRPKIPHSTRPRPDERTLDDFSGGLNIADEDVHQNTSFAKELINAHRDLDASMSFRFGTKLRFDIAASGAGGTILEMVYFRDKLVVFTTTGHVVTINDTGVITLIWSAAIAAALPVRRDFGRQGW
jgi:hypothetical protein